MRKWKIPTSMKDEAEIGKWKARVMAEKYPTHEFLNKGSLRGRQENSWANAVNICDSSNGSGSITKGPVKKETTLIHTI